MALKIWLPLNGNLENKGISDIEVTNNGATVDNNGKIGQCYYFNGNKQWLLLSQTFGNFYNNDWSIAVWLKPTDSTRSVILSEYSGSGASNVGIELTASRVVRVYWNGTPDINFTTAGAIPLNEWTHVTITKKNSIFNLYLNGILKQTYTYNGTLSTRVSNCRPRIGDDYRGNSANTVSYQGYMNDFRLYDHCLSVKEVKEISQGLILHYKLDGFSGGAGDNILTGTATQTTLIANSSSTTTNATGKWGTASGGNGTYSIINIENDTPVSGVNWGFKITNNTSGNKDFCQHNQPYVNGVTYIVSWYMRGQGTYLVRQWNITDSKQMQGKTGAVNTTEWTYYTWTFTANEELETDSCSLHLGATGNSPSLEWCAMKMEIGTVATPWTPAPQDLGIDTTKIVDSSGYENNGILTGTLETSADASRYQLSSFFNGNDTAIQIPYNATIWQDNFTMNLWFKKDELGSKNYETLIGGPSGFEIDTRANNATTLSLFMTSTRGGNAYSPFNFGEWYMITLVNDGINELYYVNGALVKTIEKKSMPTGNYFIGAWQTNIKQNYKGNISDVRIYATALSAEDILDLYHTPANIDNLGGVHGFETVEDKSAKELLALPWTSSYSTHNKTSISTNYNDKHEWYSNVYSSASSDYIKINPTGKTYYYDTEISVATGNQFYIGFERYDENKTSRSNNACVYVVAIKPTVDLIHKRYFGTVNLSTDGVNPTDTIALRILNAWTNTTSDSTKEATIHYLSLREVAGTPQTQKVYKNGQILTDEFIERNGPMSVYENGIDGSPCFIEK